MIIISALLSLPSEHQGRGFKLDSIDKRLWGLDFTLFLLIFERKLQLNL